MSVDALPAARGRLTMQARHVDDVLKLGLAEGLHGDVRIRVASGQRRSREVLVDGRSLTDFDAFRTLEAR